MTTLRHYTDLASALRIIEEGKFRPRYSDPRAGDSCLNAFMDGRPANTDQCFEREGAILRFGWSGPVHIGGKFPLKADVLHDFLPWRVAVPLGTRRHLTVVGLDASGKAWEDYFDNAPWYCITASLQRGYRLQKMKAEKARIADMIASGVSVSVVS